jgi:hypothetical protein
VLVEVGSELSFIHDFILSKQERSPWASHMTYRTPPPGFRARTRSATVVGLQESREGQEILSTHGGNDPVRSAHIPRKPHRHETAGQEAPSCRWIGIETSVGVAVDRPCGDSAGLDGSFEGVEAAFESVAATVDRE